jgi:hypothetical protein
MATLKDEVKLAIVQALACYDTPSQVAELVKLEFGITMPRQQVALYDPTKPAGKRLSLKLADLFHETRKAFLKDTASIPVAQQAYRLRVIQKEVERAQSRGNTAMVAQLLEQAAKESGGAFTNRRELTGAGGGPIAQHNVTPEELAAAVRSVRQEF